MGYVAQRSHPNFGILFIIGVSPKEIQKREFILQQGHQHNKLLKLYINLFRRWLVNVLIVHTLTFPTFFVFLKNSVESTNRCSYQSKINSLNKIQLITSYQYVIIWKIPQSLDSLRVQNSLRQEMINMIYSAF